jgi:hypothetical protein
MPTSDEDIQELKALILVAKRKPVNIGVCIGATPEETVVKMHRSRSPASLKREAKGEGETTKAACGTIEVTGREAKLVCEGLPPSGIGRKLKLYFRTIGINLSFDLGDGSSDSDEAI